MEDNKRQLLNTVTDYWQYQNNRRQEDDKTQKGLLNIYKTYKIADNALKTQQRAEFGRTIAKEYSNPSITGGKGYEAIHAMFTPDQLKAMAESEPVKQGLLSGLKQTYSPNQTTTDLATIGATATEAGVSSGQATAGAMANPATLAIMAVLGLGIGAGKKGSTLNRWFGGK
jgi:hypothetical protein